MFMHVPWATICPAPNARRRVMPAMLTATGYLSMLKVATAKAA